MLNIQLDTSLATLRLSSQIAFVVSTVYNDIQNFESLMLII